MSRVDDQPHYQKWQKIGKKLTKASSHFEFDFFLFEIVDQDHYHSNRWTLKSLTLKLLTLESLTQNTLNLNTQMYILHTLELKNGVKARICQNWGGKLNKAFL